MSIPSDEEGWAAVERVGRLLHPSGVKTHAPDVNGNAVCDPHDVLARRHTVRSGPVTCQPCVKRVAADEAAAGWEALEQHAYENGWDDE